MKRMRLWVAVLLAGLAILAVYPLFPPDMAPLGTGVFPEFLIPIGFITALIGAAGMYLAWTANYEDRRR